MYQTRALDREVRVARGVDQARLVEGRDGRLTVVCRVAANGTIQALTNAEATVSGAVERAFGTRSVDVTVGESSVEGPWIEDEGTKPTGGQ